MMNQPRARIPWVARCTLFFRSGSVSAQGSRCSRRRFSGRACGSPSGGPARWAPAGPAGGRGWRRRNGRQCGRRRRNRGTRRDGRRRWSAAGVGRRHVDRRCRRWRGRRGRRPGGGAGGSTGGAGGSTAGHDPKDGGADAVSLPGTHNPVLAGLNADPHIAEFDGVFYIYPTTDGYANWGATSFSVFSSTNLVDWTSRGRHPGPAQGPDVGNGPRLGTQHRPRGSDLLLLFLRGPADWGRHQRFARGAVQGRARAPADPDERVRPAVDQSVLLPGRRRLPVPLLRKRYRRPARS